MERDFFEGIDINEIKTPAFIVSEEAVIRNCEILDSVQRRTGCKILLALKAFSMFSLFPLMRKYLHGVCASSPHEARLGRDEFRREVHSHAAAFSRHDFDELLEFSDHIVFNSLSQYDLFKDDVIRNKGRVAFGLRVNPGHSEAPVPMYDPCAPRSRLGITKEFLKEIPEGISGIHFHALCETSAEALARTARAFEENFSAFLPGLEWLNFGGGHHITKPGYNIELLCSVVSRFMDKYNLMLYLEPGEAAALNAGILVSTVLDIVHNEIDIAILDTSAAAHMCDVLEMPFRPDAAGAGAPGEFAHTYRLAGVSCLSGDVIGDYSFPAPLSAGSKIIFFDMAHYTMVKTNTFNGIRLPSIGLYSREKGLTYIREPGYEDFKGRL
ncbi:MAG: carboxynorspermidine decarboxylase [Spirochaetia bacterium]|jgi:carboxynorspermidine decarboxylase|nr:carboxynorspermidine decarboxylase [Spirochaetia bacterium]